MTTILSTAYWAPVQYYSKLTGMSEVLLEQHENYLKQTYRNRCHIAAANGVLPLTVPVLRNHGNKMPVREVRIDYSEQWQRNHWKAIESAYRSSPFFEYYADDFRPFYEKKEVFLFDLNEKIFRLLLDLIGLKITVGYTCQFTERYPCNDFRYTVSPKIPYTDDHTFKPQIYYQVFAPANGFAANVSILDLLCNEGANALQVLQLSKSPA
jgi:hypothetical protein